MSLSTMEELLVHELRDLMSAERQIIAALPKLARKATNPELVTALEEHVAETEGQVTRLEQCLEILGSTTRGKKCKGMEGLLEEGSELAEEAEEDAVRDAGIIGSCQKVEHYEISAYGTACAYAEQLGHSDVVELLEATLEEESAANEKLTDIAEAQVNSDATMAEEE